MSIYHAKNISEEPLVGSFAFALSCFFFYLCYMPCGLAGP